MQYVDLRTGERIDDPTEYDPNLLRAEGGHKLGPDNIEALRTAGESDEFLSHLQHVGSPSSYQAGPGAEIISVDDPRFPWDYLASQLRSQPTTREVRQATDDLRHVEEQIRGGFMSKNPITSPPNIFTDQWWPFCVMKDQAEPPARSSFYSGTPRGVKWNPPVCCGYYGNYYVTGKHGGVYLWDCGHWRGYISKYWWCCCYDWYTYKPGWKTGDKVPKDWPKYKCK